jgi:peptide/nickel transport system permease protein
MAVETPRGVAAVLAQARRSPYAIVGLAIYAVFIAVGLSADILAPYDPAAILFTPDHQLAASLAPSLAHPLGTTNLGHDIFSELLLGTQPSLAVGLIAAVAVSGIGTILGLIAGFFGGWADRALMRLADVLLGLPFLPFVIVLVSLLGSSTMVIAGAVAVMLWPNVARVVRAQTMVLARHGYVDAARIGGAGEWWILLRHVAPGVLPLTFLYGTVAVGWAILTQASVSFLGFGDSNLISWGTMLEDAYANQALNRGQVAWFLPPGICIVLVVLAGFLISRGYESLLFPRLGDDT